MKSPYSLVATAIGWILDVRPFEERRLSLPDADAHRRHAVTAAAPPELVQQRHDETGAAHPEGMADRDRSAVHIHLLLVEPKLADDGEALGRERLVQLDEIDL